MVGCGLVAMCRQPFFRLVAEGFDDCLRECFLEPAQDERDCGLAQRRMPGGFIAVVRGVVTYFLILSHSAPFVVYWMP